MYMKYDVIYPIAGTSDMCLPPSRAALLCAYSYLYMLLRMIYVLIGVHVGYVDDYEY